MEYFSTVACPSLEGKNKVVFIFSFLFLLCNCISCRHTIKLSTSASQLKLLWPRCLDLYFKKLWGFALLYLGKGEKALRKFPKVKCVDSVCSIQRPKVILLEEQIKMRGTDHLKSWQRWHIVAQGGLEHGLAGGLEQMVSKSPVKLLSSCDSVICMGS